jgi:hypothetical protein
VSIFARHAEIRSWQLHRRRWPFWWTASLYINGYSSGSADRTLRFRAKTEEAAKEKAYRWLGGGHP